MIKFTHRDEGRNLRGAYGNTLPPAAEVAITAAMSSPSRVH